MCFYYLSFFAYYCQINLFFLFKCIHVPRDIEVEVVLHDFLERGEVGVFVDIGPVFIGRQNFVQMFASEVVLVFAIGVFAAGVDEQDMVWEIPIRRTAAFAGMTGGGCAAVRGIGILLKMTGC